MWIGPIHTLIVLYLMWCEIGVASLIGVATVLLFIPVQGVYYLKVIINKMESASLLTELL
jgi:ATP-binding cassette subfamily C (CFTR/MRP) protein 4